MISYGIFLLFGTYVCVTAALPSCVCTREYSPICGSDGQSYGNSCTFDCAKLTNPALTGRQGRCKANPPPCFCTFEYAPVCGTDGNTYPNKCALNCQKASNPTLEIKNAGECVNQAMRAPSCVCTRNYSPVCGTNGKTYPNVCSLECERIRDTSLQMKYPGACQSEANAIPICACPRNFKPVCGTDGVTYNNPCLLKCASKADSSVDFGYYGPCAQA